MNKRAGFFAFGLLSALILIMTVATLYEHQHGSAYAGFYFYNSMWFTLLWVLAATVGCYYIALISLHKRVAVFLLHAAFLVILAGALTTRLDRKSVV